MPVTLKIVSWNLRTFGVPKVPDTALQYIADIIVDALNPDIVCLQEIQVSSDGGGNIGDDIAVEIGDQLDDLLDKLRTKQPLAGWQYSVSGCNNSSRAKSMTDAYAFFWKGTPSAQSHADAPYAITLLQYPRILRQVKVGGDKFPGRRPGLMTFDIAPTSAQPPVPINIISWHAPTPCNTFGKAKHTTSSGRAINALATLDDIGGGMQIYVAGNGVNGYVFVDNDENLPTIDTIVLGDFNYRIDLENPAFVYENLTTHYEPCVSTVTNAVLTTYSPDPNKPFVGSSSYDNMFVLLPHDRFEPGVTFANSGGAFDFIAAAARAFDAVQPWTLFQMYTAWFVCYQDRYKRQYARPGISDHLPVWADFTVEQSSLGNAHIKATSNDDNNGLIHALYGRSVASRYGSIYVDDFAGARRNMFVEYLEGCITPTNFAAVRNDVLAAMLNYFSIDPDFFASTQFLISNPTYDPFQNNDPWQKMVAAYLEGIIGGRPILDIEVNLVAKCFDLAITQWFIDDAEYTSRVINAGGGNLRQIYQSGQNYFFYQP